MKLFIKQRAFSWFDNYKIFDEDGNPMYSIRGELSWGHCLRMYDTQDTEVCMVREKRDTLLPKFEMYVGGTYIGSINKGSDVTKNVYSIDFNGWRIEGDLMESEYQIFDGQGYQIASMTKEVLKQADTYRIKITNPQDELYVLMLMVAIDAEK
ncbi:MAG: LURP-one-related family protein [Lachnospiraceae bacterium]|nr:LURP-one-related family protein [Lachnospiraceae bacterium]MBQ8318368.1 LURP-one-related family protein [Lachnospiraceae bacterium]